MEIGSRVGPYEIRQPLGAGGMAQVWKAWHLGLHRFEALKIPTPQLVAASVSGGDESPGDERAFVARFLHEARIAAGLRHPHIATIYGVSEEDAPQPFFAMELVEGRDLAALLRARGSLGVSETLPILEAIASALDYAHQRGVIHRDIKPANVLLEAGRHGWIPKVVDFGIAHAGRAASEEAPGPRLRVGEDEDIVGTPEYMSPEQAGSGEEVGPRSDIYSLGVVAYEMLCGRPPFVAQGFGPASILEQHLSDPPPLPSTWNAELPPALDDLLGWALAKSPSQRPASATGWVQVLRDAARLQAPQTTASTWKYDDAVEAGLLTTPANAEDSASTYTAPASPTLVQARAAGRARPKMSGRWQVPAILAASLCLGAALGMVKRSTTPPASTWEPEATSESPAVQSAPGLEPTATPATGATEAPTASATAGPTAFPVKGGALEDAGADGKRRQARAESTAQRARRVKIEVIDNLLLLRKRQERDLLRPAEAEASRRRLLAQLRGALSLCEAALKLDADNETAWEQKAALLFLMGRFEKALDVAERGLQKFPANRDLRDARDKARDRLSRALQKKV